MRQLRISMIIVLALVFGAGAAWAQNDPKKDREVTVKVDSSEDGIEIVIENDDDLTAEEARKIRKESQAIVKAKTKELKTAIEKIRADYDAGKISEEEMGERISERAESMSKEIEAEALRLASAVRSEMAARMAETPETPDTPDTPGEPRVSVDKDGDERKIRINTKVKPKKKRRTYTGLALSFGWHTMLNEQNVAETIYPEMDFWKGGFTQIDFMANTRIGGRRSPIWLNYGVGLLYQKVDIAGNNILSHTTEPLFVQAPGAITSNKLRNHYVTGTLGLKIAPKGNEGFYVEMNGFAGARFRTKQNFEYTSLDGEAVVEKRTARYGVNKFNYGASAAIGYKMVSVYARYDMSSLFENTSRYDYHPLSVGVKFNLF